MTPSRISRYAQVVLGALAALVLSGCGEQRPAAAAPTQAKLEKVILQTDWYAQPEHGGFYQAQVKGYYREVGLDVEILQGGPNAIPPQKVALGTAQFGVGRTDELIIAAARGIPVVVLAALMQRDPQGVMFHPESGIRDFKDLDGRNVMAVPGAAWLTLVQLKYGIKMSVTPLDFGLSRFFADKRLVQQCFITNEPFYIRQQGVDVGVLLLSEAGIDPYRIWFTSSDYAARRPEVVRAFTAASIRGWREYIDGDRRDADVRIGQLNQKMTPEFIAFSVETMRANRLVHGDPAKGELLGRIDPARLGAEIKRLSAIGVLDRAVTLAEVFDEKFLPEDVRVVATAK
jgi:NitT/TauT family transport system substrate-binding protein